MKKEEKNANGKETRDFSLNSLFSQIFAGVFWMKTSLYSEAVHTFFKLVINLFILEIFDVKIFVIMIKMRKSFPTFVVQLLSFLLGWWVSRELGGDGND